MDSDNFARLPRNHLVGWFVIVSQNDNSTLNTKLHLGLNSFAGDYGQDKITKIGPRFAFGLRKPEKPLPLTTWSYYDDKDSFCFVEGVFYDEYCHHQPVDGQDPILAQLLLKKYFSASTRAIEALNGSFSGLIYSYKTKEIITFVDRLGTKVLYWSNENDSLIVSSNLAAFRGVHSLTIDSRAAFQSLTIGFPIGERTLLKEVKIQPPCTVNIFTGCNKESKCYWRVPKRQNHRRLRDAVEILACSMENAVTRIHGRLKQEVALGLTGGHDSRLILSALAYKKLPFRTMAWEDRSFNDRIAHRLCNVIEQPLTIAREFSDSEINENGKNVFLYSDGSFLHHTGFSRLGKECFEQGSGCLMIGNAGDLISGSLTVPAPRYLKNVEDLAQHTLQQQMELLSFTDAHSLMKAVDRDSIQETISEWTKSFANGDSHEQLPDIAIWQRLSNRNLKRIRFSIAPASRYSQIIFPYLDNKVMDAYFSLPVDYLTYQKAHCYAGFHRFPKFGQYQACGYPLSLRNEALFPFGLCFLRRSREKIIQVSNMLGVGEGSGSRTQKHRDICSEVIKSPLFREDIVNDRFTGGQLAARDLNKMHTLSKAYEFYVCGDNRLIEDNQSAKRL